MARQELYIDGAGTYRTGQLREASSDLLFVSGQVVERCATLASGGVMVQSVAVANYRSIIGAVREGPDYTGTLGTKTWRKWNKAEVWVGRMLHAARILDNPEAVNQTWQGCLRLPPQAFGSGMSTGFFDATRNRLTLLLSDAVQEELDSLRLGSWAHLESRVLRGIVFGKVYRLEPRPFAC